MNTRGTTKTIRSLREIPEGVAPDRDLWPGISSRLAPRRRSWAVPASLAAGFLLAAVGVIVGMQIRQAQSPVAQQAPGSFIRAALLSDPAYESHRSELLAALPTRLERLSPASRQRVLDSLRAVQTAMRNLEAELGKDGSNALLQELFIGACQEEMRVLTAVDAIGGSTQEI
ncbi:MAG TPA: hypothetical protein VKO83_09095 [Steroidobacteraceae bacterium]|nr:hypothetical protein [Steroidobacteraceae bacterium]